MGNIFSALLGLVGRRANTRRSTFRFTRPRLEYLEDRLVLDAVIWKGADAASWNIAGNWSTVTVPTRADDVTIPGANSPDTSGNCFAKSVTITAKGNLTVTGNLTVGVGGVKDNGTLTLKPGGILVSAGDVVNNLNANIVFISGTINGNVINQQNAKISVKPVGAPGDANPIAPAGSISGKLTNNGLIDLVQVAPVKPALGDLSNSWFGKARLTVSNFEQTDTGNFNVGLAYWTNPRGASSYSDSLNVSLAATLKGTLSPDYRDEGIPAPANTVYTPLFYNPRIGDFGTLQTPATATIIKDIQPNQYNLKVTGKVAHLGVPSNTAIVSTGSPSDVGQAVTFTATVTGIPLGPTPTGTVTFYDTYAIGTGTLNSNGVATLSTGSLGVGSHTILAVYEGDGTYGSSQASLTQTVNALASATALTVTPSTSVFGQSVTFTATASGSGGTPTGTIDFFSDGNWIDEENVGVNGTASFSSTALPTGSHQFTATYNGDATYNVSSGSVSQTVNAAATTTAVVSSTNPSQARA